MTEEIEPETLCMHFHKNEFPEEQPANTHINCSAVNDDDDDDGSGGVNECLCSCRLCCQD